MIGTGVTREALTFLTFLFATNLLLGQQPNAELKSVGAALKQAGLKQVAVRVVFTRSSETRTAITDIHLHRQQLRTPFGESDPGVRAKDEVAIYYVLQQELPTVLSTQIDKLLKEERKQSGSGILGFVISADGKCRVQGAAFDFE